MLQPGEEKANHADLYYGRTREVLPPRRQAHAGRFRTRRRLARSEGDA